MKAMISYSGTSRAKKGDPGLLFRENLLWAIAGNTLYALCQWGMLISLAKLSTPSAMGLFALGLAVSTPAVMMAGLSLRAVQATDAADEYDFSSYFCIRLISVVLSLLAIISICLLAGYSRRENAVVLLIGLAKCIESISDIVFGKFQQKERIDLIARSMIIKGIASVGAFVLILSLSPSLVLAVAGWVITWTAVLFLIDIPWVVSLLRDKPGCEAGNWAPVLFRSSLKHVSLKGLAWLSLPLGAVMGLSALVPNIPRYIIEHKLGLVELGVFSALAYLATPGNVVATAIGYVSGPRLANYCRQGKSGAFKRLLVQVLTLGAGFGLVQLIAFAIGGRPLLTFLLNDRLASYMTLLCALLIGAIFSYGFGILGIGVTAMRLFKVQFYVHLGLTILILALSLLLIPKLGLFGAAISVGCAMAVASLAYGLILRWHLSRLTMTEQATCEKSSSPASYLPITPQNESFD